MKKLWTIGTVAAMACSLAGSGPAVAHNGPHAAAPSWLGAPTPAVRTTLGPVQPLSGADERALYGTAAGKQRATTSFRRRGCRIARTKAKYTNHGVRTFTLIFNSRFCWDKGKKKAVQRGLQDAHHDVSNVGAALGVKISGDTPLKAFSERWHRGAKGMTHMNARYQEEVCKAYAILCSDYTVYISQHGHWDGTVYDHQYTTKQ